MQILAVPFARTVHVALKTNQVQYLHDAT